MIYQAFYRCNECSGIFLLEHEKGDIRNPKRSNIKCDKWKQDQSLCSFWKTKPILIAIDVNLRGYFECPNCHENIVMPMKQEWHISENYPRNCFKCRASGITTVLKYISSGPEESFYAYENLEGWGDITKHIQLTRPPREEADSQRNVRAYLINMGYGFLAGTGGTEQYNVELEFTTYHPTFTIEEPGFKEEQYLTNISSVILTPRISCGVLGKDTRNATWPDFVVTDGIEKMTYELKTPKKYVTKIGELLGKKINLGNKEVTVGTDIGFTGAWLFHYAEGIHLEAWGRKKHMPKDYKNIFLIDLTVVEQNTSEVIKDIETIMNQTAKREPYGEKLFIFSEAWWKKYWYSLHFFYQNKIVKTNFPNKIKLNLTPYSEWPKRIYVDKIMGKIKEANPPSTGLIYSQEESEVMNLLKTEIDKTFAVTDNWDQLCDDIIQIALYSEAEENPLLKFLKEVQTSKTQYRKL